MVYYYKLEMCARTRNVKDEDLLEEFRASEDAFLTAAEIAESVGMTRQNVNRRLRELHKNGVLKRKQAGARAVGYWLSESPESAT